MFFLLTSQPGVTPQDSWSLHWYLGEVQSKQCAVSLSLQWLYNYGIDLLPSALLLSSCLYNLTWPEWEAMEKYICELPAAGLMWPSSSPRRLASSSFRRRMVLTIPALTIKHWMTSHPRISTHYHFPTVLLVHSVEPGSSPNSECLPSGPNSSRRWVEDCLQHPVGVLWLPGDALWSKQQPCSVPVIGDWYPSWQVEQVHLHLYRQHPHLFRDEGGTSSGCPPGTPHLLKNKLFVKAEKCDFNLPFFFFLVFVVQQGQLTPDPAKVRAVAKGKTLSSHKQLQHFFGLLFFFFIISSFVIIEKWW